MFLRVLFFFLLLLLLFVTLAPFPSILQEQLAVLEKQFGHKQKKKDEDEVVEEKTLLHSELCEPHEYLVYHHCSEVKGQLTGVF